MKLNLRGKTVVVTGAAGGIGLATISLLLKYNVDILALDIQKPKKKIFQNKKVTYHQIDLVNELELTRVVKEFIKKYKRIDYLVNTTGVLWFGKDVSA
ncbi:MAG: short-chain dehydrogenase, partial [Woeseiaceae bacterium]|nr:short-chain dehydrogenase [Woeseiaceae bacterium]